VRCTSVVCMCISLEGSYAMCLGICMSNVLEEMDACDAPDETQGRLGLPGCVWVALPAQVAAKAYVCLHEHCLAGLHVCTCKQHPRCYQGLREYGTGQDVQQRYGWGPPAPHRARTCTCSTLVHASSRKWQTKINWECALSQSELLWRGTKQGWRL